MPRGIRKTTAWAPSKNSSTVARDITRTKTQPKANKVVKPKVLTSKGKAARYKRILSNKFEDLPPVNQEPKKSRYPTKATDRISGKAAHFRKVNIEQFYHIEAPKQEEELKVPGVNHWPRLEKELRAIIFYLVVVEHARFVWPMSETGKMQPDVSRVCKMFRQESLVLYYSHNRFAFDLEYRLTPSGYDISPVVSFAIALSKRGTNWLRKIRKWAFTMDVERKQVEEASTEDAAVVEPRKPEYDTVVYKFDVPGPQSKRSPVIEVHTDAVCLQRPETLCVLRANPAELHEGVIAALWESDKRVLTPKVLYNLTAYLAGAAEAMLATRCDRELRPATDRLRCMVVDDQGTPVAGSDIADNLKSDENKTAKSTALTIHVNDMIDDASQGIEASVRDDLLEAMTVKMEASSSLTGPRRGASLTENRNDLALGTEVEVAAGETPAIDFTGSTE